MLMRAHCLAAASADLLTKQACSAAVGALEANLLQRLQNSWLCSRSSSAAVSTFSLACTTSTADGCCTSTSSSSSSSSSSGSAFHCRQQPSKSIYWQQTRYYAQAPRFEDRFTPGRSRSSSSSGSSSSSSSGGSGGRRLGRMQRSSRDRERQAPVQLSELRLGRSLQHLQATEVLWEGYDLAQQRDPFRDRDPLDISPVQPDGSRSEALEEPLLLRQQLEGSGLPSEFKRSHFISPSWDEVLLDVNRTVKVTKGGKVETLHALVVVGNHDGLLGVGQHSGKNIQKVMLDAQLKAYQNLVAIPRYRGHTVYHPIDVKVRKIRLQAWPRELGFGITASPVVTELCDLAGLHNVTVKLSGNRSNIRNLVQVFVEALSHQSVPHDGVEGSAVYMREVYAGKLPCGLRRGIDVP